MDPILDKKRYRLDGVLLPARGLESSCVDLKLLHSGKRWLELTRDAPRLHTAQTPGVLLRKRRSRRMED